MLFEKQRLLFEQQKHIKESVLLSFKGVDGFDVYNCSVPFMMKGKLHLYGRIERRNEWIQSRVRLFIQTGKDEFTLVPNKMTYQLEDPFVSCINKEMIFGGTQVIKNKNEVQNYYCDFYRGSPDHLTYFTSGPDRMKDIRLVELADKRIGVFSHHKTDKSCLTGFVTIDRIEELNSEIVNSAKPIDHTFFGDAWGGVNQAYLLTSGKIGCISHHGYVGKNENGVMLNVYCITSFVYNPETNEVYDFKILGTKNCFPPTPSKDPKVEDCAFVSGIVMRDDGKCDLYSGVGDTREGRMVIDYPFEGHGKLAHDFIEFEECVIEEGDNDIF